MKIAHVITGLGNGGAEGVLYRLVTNDKKNEHIIISLTNGGKYVSLFEEKGIKVFCLALKQSGISLKGLRKLNKLLKDFKPDIVQTWMYHADLIGGMTAYLAGYRSIFWNIRHTELKVGLSKKSTIYTAKASALMSYIIPKKIICCANNAAQVHQNIGYDKKKLIVIPNGFELDKFVPNDSLKDLMVDELFLDKSSDIIGMVGRYDVQKDHLNLLKAVEIVLKSRPNLKVLLVGKDLNKNNNDLMNEVKKLKLENSIFLLDQRKDISAIMNTLDIHVLSSSFGEGFPNVLAEAMACGVPCIATNVGDSALIVGDTGWIVPASDPKNLADAVLTGLLEKDSKQQWALRKRAARQRILENFDIENMVKNYNNIWEST